MHNFIQHTSRMGRLRAAAIPLLFAFAQMMSAQAGAVDAGAKTATFNIAALQLADALSQFGAQSGLQVVYSPDVANGLRSKALTGKLTADAALERLLSGTGVTWSYVNGDTVVLKRAEAKREAGTLKTAQGQMPDASAEVDSQENEELSEIVVTAQKRGEQSVTDVPISIAVLRGTDLEGSGARGVSDALNLVGGVNLVEVQPGRATISIRGASAGEITLTGAAPVGYYLDELPFAFITNAFLPDANAFDLERVEVLRGPQGTLYGASSLNGVVRILTNDANMDEFEFRGRSRYASTKNGDASFGGDFVANLPLVPGKLGVRAVASYADLGGYIDTATTRDFNDSQVGNYRFKVNAAPSDHFSIELGASFSRINNDGASEADDNYTTFFSSDQGVERDYDAYNLILSYDFPSLSVLSSTGYIDLSGTGAYDFLLGGALQTSLTDNLGAKLFTQEVRATSRFEGPWQVSGGVFYRDIDQLLDQGVFDLLPFRLSFLDRSKSHAIFGEVTRSLMDGKMELIGGVRYFEDTVTTNELSSLFTGTAGPLLDEVESDFDAVTWRAVLNYHLNRAQTFYASIATGFRSGFNQAPTSLAVEPNLPPIEADELITYELGAKGISANGVWIYDTAFYYTEWDGAQQFRLTSLGSAAVINANRVSGFGIDASVAARFTQGFSMSASAGWNSLEFQSDTLQQSAVLYPKGERINRSPEHTAGLGAEYRFPMGRGGLEGFVAGDGRYTSELIAHDVVGGLSVTTRSDDVMNANFRIGVKSDHWILTGFAENLTDENAAIEPGTTSSPLPARLRPRTIGLQATFEF